MHSWLLAMLLATRIYVADTGGSKLTVIDSGKAAGTISVSSFPQGITSDGRRLYVTSGANVLDVIDPNTSRLIRTISFGSKPGDVAISPDQRSVFVCSDGRPAIDVVDTASLMQVKTIETSGIPRTLEVTPDNTRLLAGFNGGIDVINIRTGEREFGITLPGAPVSIAIESDRHLGIRRLFVHLAGKEGFEIVDYASRKVTGRVPLPSANQLAVSPNRRTLWVTAGDSVVVFGLPDLKRAAMILTGAGADAIVFEGDGKNVWISDTGADSVTEIDTASYKVVTRVTTGKAPGQMIAVE